MNYITLKTFLVYFFQLNFRNPWISDVWQSMFNCSSESACADKRLDLNEFQVDSKVDFVADAVRTFSDALER